MKSTSSIIIPWRSAGSTYADVSIVNVWAAVVAADILLLMKKVDVFAFAMQTRL